MIHKEGQTDWIQSLYSSAVEWWGESWYEGENLKDRLDIVKKYGKGNEVLELAAGTGETAAYLCEHGYSVTAVDLCKANISLMNKMRIKYKTLSVIEANMLELQLDRKFPTVCIFEAFGLGSDKEQRILLKKIADEWLADDGVLVMDVYHPFMPMRSAGSKLELDKLPDVPGSVDMTDYTYFDPVKCRWIDVWEPRQNKTSAKVQSIRCYTPADFLLLTENTGMRLEKLEFRGKNLEFHTDEVSTENIFDNDDRWYSYLAVMKKA